MWKSRRRERLGLVMRREIHPLVPRATYHFSMQVKRSKSWTVYTKGKKRK
jgi:hypothetical protein